MEQSVDVDSTSLDATFARVSEAALRLHGLAASRNLELRLIGSLAVRLRCPRSGYLFEAMGRRPYRDIDFMGLERQKREIETLFEADGWIADPALKYSQEFDIKRLIFSRPNGELKVDVFLDELVMAHTIDFRGRLELDSPTVTLVDLLLSKLQIHDITENDLIDVLALLAEHEVDGAGNESIDLGRILELMRSDWGFYHTATLNLEKAQKALSAAALRSDIVSAISARLTGLGSAIEAEPKTLRWKLRGEVGTRVRWYQDVPEVERD
jgi:hypothetical protein